MPEDFRNDGDNSPPLSPSISPPDPFDPAVLRLDPGAMAADFGVRKAIVSVPVRKPAKDEWIRVHPDPDFALQTGILELKSEREIYLVARPLWPELNDETTFNRRAIFSTISRQGVFFLWPVRLPNPDGKLDSWNASAMEAAILAQNTWVRMTANMALGAYDVTKASVKVADPVWPETSFRDLLSIAFKDRLLDSLDHPVLKRLRGEI